MGQLMRRYWLPALLASEIPEPDSPPVRVHLLGEDLSFAILRKIKLLDEHCTRHSCSSAEMKRRPALHFSRLEDDVDAGARPRQPLATL
jgi:hypothetical protein